MPLFRAESEEARARAWLGRVVLVRPLSFTLTTVAAIAMAACLAAYFVLGDYTRKARVVGSLAPAEGLVRVVAQQTGRVEGLEVAEGREVVRDEVLLSVVDARGNDAVPDPGDAIARRIRARRTALDQQRGFVMAALDMERSALAQRRGGLVRELDLLEREIEAQAARAALADRTLDRARRLGDVGFVSAAGIDRETEGALEQESRLQALRRSRLALARERDALAFEIASAQARGEAQLAALELQRAALEQERIERELANRIDVIAPAPGIVATVMVEPGQAVSAGTTLATIIPAGAPLEAHLYAPSRSIGFVRPGQEVLLRFPSYPHQKFGLHRGTIASISRSASAPAELGFAPPDGSREPLYRIKVTLGSQTIEAYGRPEPLRAGMQVEADVLLDRRRLIEWIFEPLLSLAGRA